MTREEKKLWHARKKIKKDQTVKSLISSFRIENIHISKSEAAEIYRKVETRIKKLAL